MAPFLQHLSRSASLQFLGVNAVFVVLWRGLYPGRQGRGGTSRGVAAERRKFRGPALLMFVPLWVQRSPKVSNAFWGG